MKSKIALVQPIVEMGKSLRIQKSPTGMQAIAGALKREGHDIQMYHEEFNANLFRNIFNFNPDYIGISTMTANFLAGKDVADMMKMIHSNIPIILGGWHASGCANSYLNGYESWSLEEILNPKSPFDYIVVGEGDRVAPELIRKLNEKESLDNLKGVGYLDENGEIKVSRAERIWDLDGLVDPLWESLDINKYRDLRTGEMDLSVHAQRGCRFQCTYCATPDAYPERKTTRFSPNRIVDYIEQLVNENNPSVITFTDEDFMANLRWVEQVCDELVKRRVNNKVKFDTFASINDINKSKIELLKKMKQAGFNSYFVGIESLNPQTLEMYRRPCKKGPPIEEYMKMIQRAIDLSNEAGLKFLGDYMIGAFWETKDQVREGFNRLTQLRGIPYVYLPILIPLPGTGLWKYAVDNNILIKQSDGSIDWSKFDASKQVIKSPYKTKKLREELEQKFYTSSGYREWMELDVSRNPIKREEFYLPYINKLSNDYPKNKQLQLMAKQLKSK